MDAFPGETFTGRIARVAPVLDPATRTAPIEIEIPNPDFRLKPGMYARVGDHHGTKKDALVVPSNAVVDLGGRRGVFQHQNGTAVFRTVQVGTESRTLIEILGGLTEGDQVITTGARRLRDGDRVLLAGGEGGGVAPRRGDGPRPREGGGDGGAATAGARGRQAARAATADARPAATDRSRRSGGDGTDAGRRRGTQSGAVSAGTAAPRGTSGDGDLTQVIVECHMSIPRLAIQRPVTMFMISGVITLLGADLADAAAGRSDAGVRAADAQRPHQLPRRRPARDGRADHPADRAGGQRRARPRRASTSSSSEGNSQVQLNFEWGTDLSEAADEVRTRMDRIRGRLPEDADPPTIFKFDSNQLPVMQIGVEGDYDPVTLREIAQNELAPALRARATASPPSRSTAASGGRSTSSSRRRRSPRSTSRSTGRQHAAAARTRTRRSARSTRATRRSCVRSQGQFQSLDDIRNLVVLTREGVPVYLRDIAEVQDTTEAAPLSSCGSTASRASRSQVQKQSGKNTVAVAEAGPRGSRAHQQRGPRHQDDGDAGQLGVHRARDRPTCRSTRWSAASSSS